jgi:DNA repair exonuclease SbcCD nuclease subunit
MALRIAHLSDTHLGYEAYPALSAAGNNQRGEDVVRAMNNIVNDILAWGPDLVIHSGDVLEKPKTDIRYMLMAQKLFRKLAAIAPVVVIAGNHELPRSRKEACWLDLLAGTENLHVVTSNYEIVRPKGLDGVCVHAVPHDVLKEIDQNVIVPNDGCLNVLTAHGVATGSELFLRSLGREYAIEADTLLRDWEYAALGHWHRQGPVNLGAAGVRQNVWYAGSPENMGFRDLRDNGEQRGYLRVTVDEGSCSVVPVHLPIRSMYRLPVVEGAGLEAAELVDQLIGRIEKAEVHGSVVGQIVNGVNRDMWSLVDVAKVRNAAKSALHYEITVKYPTVETATTTGERPDGTGAFEAAVAAEIEKLVPENLQSSVLEKTRALVGAEIGGEAP